MGLSCGAKVLKYCLFGFNLVFVIAGIACFSIGIWLIVDRGAVDKLDQAFHDMKKEDANITASSQDLSQTPTGVRDLGIVLASVGGITVLIAFMGCCGAVKEWRPLLALYALFLLIILASEIAAAIYAAVRKNEIEGDFKAYLAHTLKHYGGSDSNKTAMRGAWDYIMENNDCCGVHREWMGQRGFNASKWSKEAQLACSVIEDDLYPPACCGKMNNAHKCASDPPFSYCSKDIADSTNKTGCYEVVRDFVQKQMAVLIGVGVAVALIQVFGVLCAMCLCRAISQEMT